jgi:periplasmic divalent cation tolerance protein
MTGKLIVFVTCQRSEEAEIIARTVVEEHLAACVNVLPGVRSCYMWGREMKWSEEVLLLIKTTEVRFLALQSRIRELNSY